MFQLTDIRKTRVWQEAREEGREEGREQGKSLTLKEVAKSCVEKGLSVKEIANS